MRWDVTIIDIYSSWNCHRFCHINDNLIFSNFSIPIIWQAFLGFRCNIYRFQCNLEANQKETYWICKDRLSCRVTQSALRRFWLRYLPFNRFAHSGRTNPLRFVFFIYLLFLSKIYHSVYCSDLAHWHVCFFFSLRMPWTRLRRTWQSNYW